MPQWFKRIAMAARSTPTARRPALPSETQIAQAVCRAAARDADAAAATEQQARSAESAAAGSPHGDPQLLARRLTALRLPNFLSEHDRLAQRGGAVAFDYRSYLLHLATREAAARDRHRIARLIRTAGFPTAQDLGGFDPAAIPRIDRGPQRHLADGGFVERGENVVVLGGSGSGRTRLAIGLGFAVCYRGRAVRYTTAATLVADLNAAFDERRLLRLHRQLDSVSLLIIDDLGAVPLSASDAALLFEVFSRRAEQRSTLVTSGMPPEDWGRIFGSGRLADAVVDRLARPAHRLEADTAIELADWLRRPADAPVWRAGPLGDCAAPSPATGRAPAAAAHAEVLCG